MTDEAGRRLLTLFDAIGQAALVYGLLATFFAVSPIAGILLYRRFKGELFVVGGTLGGVIGAVPMTFGSSTVGGGLILLGVGGAYGVLVGMAALFVKEWVQRVRQGKDHLR